MNLPHPRGKNETKRPIFLHYHHKSWRKIFIKWNPTRSTQKKKRDCYRQFRQFPVSTGPLPVESRSSVNPTKINSLAVSIPIPISSIQSLQSSTHEWYMADIGQLIGTYFGWNKRIDMKKNESETSTEQTLFTNWWFSKSRYKYTITRNVQSQPLQNRIRCINSLRREKHRWSTQQTCGHTGLVGHNHHRDHLQSNHLFFLSQ